MPKDKESFDSGTDNAGQAHDLNYLGFTWDIFDDLSWSWNLDTPPIAIA
jgi:hypothetical protein